MAIGFLWYVREGLSIHLVDGLGALELSACRSNELQYVLDENTRSGLSFSTVDYLRWDLKQIFDMAVAEGLPDRVDQVQVRSGYFAARQ